MDPLAAPLACPCIDGYAQRDYAQFAAWLGKQLQRPVELAHAEHLADALRWADGRVHIVIGKFSEVVSDARGEEVSVRPLALLTGKDGAVTQHGLFVVRNGDDAKSVGDVNGRTILFGPAASDEKHAAAFTTLEAFGVGVAGKPPTRPGCNIAAIDVLEKAADAAVISSYAYPLLEGCGTIAAGELRGIGRTDSVPFITMFVTDRVTPEEARDIERALPALRRNRRLLRVLESSHGFVGCPPLETGGDSEDWAEWRGPGRRAVSPHIPASLPDRPILLWNKTLTGPGMSGPAVAGQRVIVADRDLDGTRDIFRCLDADTGRELWRLAYDAPGDLDFTSSPRATPVVHDGVVYLLGAFGHLHCVRLDSGEIVWKRHLVEDFNAELPQWGMSATPLVVDDKLIVNPGGPEASVVALGRKTGKVVWQTPGNPAAYSSFVAGTFGGRRQVVGYDATSLGGWDLKTGKRLWTLTPQVGGDFNVPTPIEADGKLVVSTENNGTRVYAFEADGTPRQEPLAVNANLSPDTSTPVLYKGRLYGAGGRLVCLDVENALKTVWTRDDQVFGDYCTFLAGNDRVLVVTQTGQLYLLKAGGARYQCVGRLDLFAGEAMEEKDLWGHPAIVGNRLYVRNLLGVYCYLLE